MAEITRAVRVCACRTTVGHRLNPEHRLRPPSTTLRQPLSDGRQPRSVRRQPRSAERPTSTLPKSIDLQHAAGLRGLHQPLSPMTPDVLGHVTAPFRRSSIGADDPSDKPLFHSTNPGVTTTVKGDSRCALRDDGLGGGRGGAISGLRGHRGVRARGVLRWAGKKVQVGELIRARGDAGSRCSGEGVALWLHERCE